MSPPRLERIAFYAEKLAAVAERGPEHLVEARRWLCLNDLFYLLTVALRPTLCW